MIVETMHSCRREGFKNVKLRLKNKAIFTSFLLLHRSGIDILLKSCFRPISEDGESNHNDEERYDCGGYEDCADDSPGAALIFRAKGFCGLLGCGGVLFDRRGSRVDLGLIWVAFFVEAVTSAGFMKQICIAFGEVEYSFEVLADYIGSASNR